MPIANEGIAFPVAKLRALADLRWPVADRGPVGDLDRPASSAKPAPAFLVAAGEVFPEPLRFLDGVVNELIDRFVVDLFRCRAEPFAYFLFHSPGDLLG